ncbi:MAG: LamG domain-containing protein, partial [Candidatus Pacearchaeota archaeon]|nr:LamG domain-containing protein [Candidatus Pacearchaeota archaeon]
WNGTNSTLFDSSLRLMYNFDNRSSLGENDSYPVNIVGGNAQITFNSAKYSASGKYGGSYEFNGTNYLELDGSSLDGFSDLSVELWVNRETNSDCVYYGCTFAGYPVGNSVFYPPVEGTYWIGEYDGQICLYIGENYQSTCVPSGWVQQNKWQHLVFVHDSDLDTDKIYVNGIEKVSKSGRTEDPDIGNYYYDIGGERLVGNIDEVKMWNRTLSSEEAKQEYYSNLYKYDSNKFVFSVKPVLDRGSYTYQASIKNSSNSLFSTELRDLTVVSKKIGYIYGADGLAAKVNKNTGKIYAYIKDLGGRLKAVVDTDTNEIVWKQEYYMSGEPATPQVEETFGQAGLKYDLVTGLLIGSNVMDPAGGGGIGADKPCDGSCCLDDCPESGSGSYYTT